MDNNVKNIDLSYTVAAVQFNPIQGNVQHNQHRMAELLTEAAESGAKLVVFPEMASSGYVWNDRQEIAPFVETVPGPTTEALLSVTSKYRCYVVIGLPEIDSRNGAYYNSAVLIGPDGIVGKYRKTHLFSADARWAREGNEEIPVFDTELGRIALLICMDAMYFEPSRIAALQEADIIAFPTNWVGAGNNQPSKTWCLRAKENAMYWVASNRSDSERGAHFTGGSAVIGTDGSVHNSLVSGEGIVYGQVELNADKRRSIMEGRRPHRYQELLLHPYLWREGETRTVSSPDSYEIIVIPLGHSGIASQLLEWLHLSMEQAESRLQTDNRLFVLPELEFDRTFTSKDLDHFLMEIQKLAITYGGYIAIGLTRSYEADPITSAYLVGRDGTVSSYRQVHHDVPGRGVEDNIGFRTFELPFGRVGLLTGKDAKYPESYRVLAKQGADIIAISESWRDAGETWIQRIWAFENDAVLACARPLDFSESLLFLHREVNLNDNSNGESIIQIFHPHMTAASRSRPFMRRLKNHLYDRLV